MRSRIVIIFIGLCALWALMLSRAAFLQIWPNQRLTSLQKRQYETSVTLNSRRGDVLDRKGHELAASMAVQSLYADPKMIADPHRTAKILSHELDLPYKLILSKLKQKQKHFVWIQRALEKPAHDRIEQLAIKGLGFIEESKRIYPNDKLLGQVLGFVGNDGAGLEGLEARYNDVLEADKKQVSLEKDARGRPLIKNGLTFNEAPDGADVQLTIDRELQYILEQELAAAVTEYQADNAVGVVLDAQTSEILAMANAPSFDPNHPNLVAPEHHRNRSVTDAFEPGSTMKTFLIAGALTRNLLDANTKWDCEDGEFHIGKRVIHEADAHHRFKFLTTTEILAYSSNIGATKIGMKMGDEALRETLERFGFGERTGVDLPGEAKGALLPLPWREHLLSNISFGHGIAATPLQIANAYASIANGGWLKQPYIVKSVLDHENGAVRETQPRTLKRVLMSDVAAKLRLMLAGTTIKEGTGFNARVIGFPVAGKTGTAQKVNPNGRGYLPKTYISSFAGFLPANDPKFVIYVAVDNPRKDFYGSQVAAPIFAHVAQFAVRQAGLAPVLFSTENMVPKAVVNEVAASVIAKPAFDEVIPDLTGLSLREVVHRLSGTGLELNVQGRGFVSQMAPAPGTPMNQVKKMSLVLEQTE